MYSVVAKQSAVQLYMCDSPAVFDELQAQTRYQHAWLLSAQLELQLPDSCPRGPAAQGCWLAEQLKVPACHACCLTRLEWVRFLRCVTYTGHILDVE